jgi:hypothetical protein
MLSKEAFVTLPAVFLLLGALGRRGFRTTFLGRNIGIALAIGSAVIVYMILRTKFGGALSGAYGSYPDLLRHAHPLRILHPFALPPVDIALGDVADCLRIVLALALLFAGALALAAQTRATILTAGALGCAMLPVIGMGVALNSASGGRLLYWPGVHISLLCGIGLAEATGTSSARFWNGARACVVTLICACMVNSLLYQQRMWSVAEALARSCMHQLERTQGASHVYVTNLPYQLVEGPYVLKSYALSYYCGDDCPLVRADRVLLKYRGGQFEAVATDRDPFSQYDTAADELVVTLQWATTE